ncbi:hypothetical protein V8J88_19545 [Massilia sp. W12]|uniref:hypothetical protein n=1 Tax=Massilia sp. W12 TaxID=3126507 RepID=UPI0030CFE5F5
MQKDFFHSDSLKKRKTSKPHCHFPVRTVKAISMRATKQRAQHDGYSDGGTFNDSATTPVSRKAEGPNADGRKNNNMAFAILDEIVQKIESSSIMNNHPLFIFLMERAGICY